MTRRNTFPWLAAGFLLLIISALAYLPLTPQMGFYHDDWFPTAARLTGTSLFEMFSIDRPFLGNLYAVTYSIFGDNPLLWQLFAYLVRLAGGFSVLWLMNLIFPGKLLIAIQVSLLFLLYPGFLQSYNASTFQNHFICYTSAIFSITLCLQAMQTKRWWMRLPMIIFSAGLIIFYLRIYEYMIGLEAIRIVLIVYQLRRKFSLKWKQIFRRFALEWIPYLAGSIIFLYWRFFRFTSVRTATDAGLLIQKYLTEPLPRFFSFFIELAKDTLETLFFGWFEPGYTFLTKAHYLDLMISVAISLVIIGLASFIPLIGAKNSTAKHNAVADNQIDRNFTSEHWQKDAIWLGIFFVILALTPSVLSDRDIQFRANLDKYTLHATFGAALFTIGFISFLFKERVAFIVFLLLSGWSAFTHYHNAAYYRDYWEYQRQFWWQMSWRAPGLQNNTTLVAVFPEGYQVAEDFETWVPARLVYDPETGPLHITAEVLNSETAIAMKAGLQTEKDFRTIQYKRDFSRLLLLSLPSPSSCLHVIDGARPEHPQSEDPLLFWISDVSQIKQIDTTQEKKTPPAGIFGSSPPHEWCYYYQSIELERQKADWRAAALLADMALQAGFVPQDKSEWLPVYEVYFRSEQPEKASLIAKEINNDPETKRGLCYFLVESNFDLNFMKQALSELCSGWRR